MSTTVKYNGNTIATLTNQRKKLDTNQKWLTNDIEIEDVTYGIGNVTQDENGYIILDDDAYLQRTFSVEEIANRTALLGDITISGDTIGTYAFGNCVNLTGVTANNFVGNSTDTSQFRNCQNLKTIEFKSLTTGCPYMFYNCTNITGAIDENIFPELADAYEYFMYGCSGVTSLYLPKYTGTVNKQNRFRNITGLVNVNLPMCRIVCNYDFYQCTNLTTVILGKNSDSPTRSIKASSFQNSTKLNSLVLYGDVIWTLDNISAFNNTPFASGKAGGTLYIPRDKITDYQQATNWSTILGYETNSIVAIEDSEYGI